MHRVCSAGENEGIDIATAPSVDYLKNGPPFQSGDREEALFPALVCSGLPNSWSCQTAVPPTSCCSCVTAGLQLQPAGDGCSDLTARDSLQLT